MQQEPEDLTWTLAQAPAAADDDEDDGGGDSPAPAEDDPTTFEDVGLCLLLFFMVMSLLVEFPDVKQTTEQPLPEEQKQDKAPGAVKGETLRRADDCRTHFLMIESAPATAETGGFLVHLARADDPRPPDLAKRRGPFFARGAAAGKKDPRTEFDATLLELGRDVDSQPGCSDEVPEQRPIEVLVQVRRDVRYAELAPVLQSLTELAHVKDDRTDLGRLRRKLGRISWLAEVKK